MNISPKMAYDLLEEIYKAEVKLNKWRKHGIGLAVTKETYEVLKESDHPHKDFILHGLLVERRGKLRF